MAYSLFCPLSLSLSLSLTHSLTHSLSSTHAHTHTHTRTMYSFPAPCAKDDDASFWIGHNAYKCGSIAYDANWCHVHGTKLPQPNMNTAQWDNPSSQGFHGSLQMGDVITSPNGAYDVTLQTDGNMVVYRKSDANVEWASNTHGQQVWASMQADGNFVIYSGTTIGDRSNGHLFDTNTYGNVGAFIQIQNDGNLVLYDSKCHAKWASKGI